MTKTLEWLNGIIWGVPALVLILGVGLYLTSGTGAAQITLFPKACSTFCKRLRKKEAGQGSVSPFRALCTALAATIGTGNLAGVAGAIAIGGPGVVFWMWCSAILGMVTKFAEATLAVRFRVKDSHGGYVSGPMYIIREGMGTRWAWLGSVYCFFGVVAAFGVGNATQINTVVAGINQAAAVFGRHLSTQGNLLLGVALGILVMFLLMGGAKRIGSLAERLVPFAALLYLLLGFGVLALRWQRIPGALAAIVEGAFTPRAVTGGIVGSGFQTLRIGVSRGVFTNEAGMGTAAIAHGAAAVQHPVEQGLMGIIEVFLDTIVICTMTALVILCSGIPVPYGEDTGILLTTEAFTSVYGGWVSVFIALSVCCFAIATILGWGLYGIRCAQYLFGERVWKLFAVVQSGIVVAGAMMKSGTVWMLSELFNGLMAIPNLIALAVLSPEVVGLTREYKRKFGRHSASGGTYEHLNQCKSLRTLSHEKIPSSRGCGKKTG